MRRRLIIVMGVLAALLLALVLVGRWSNASKVRSLPADIWVSSHDPEGYRAYIDNGEAEFRRGVMH